jgi:hypothetical protein
MNRIVARGSLARVAQTPPGSVILGPQPVPADINREIALSLLAKLSPDSSAN